MPTSMEKIIFGGPRISPGIILSLNYFLLLYRENQDWPCPVSFACSQKGQFHFGNIARS